MLEVDGLKAWYGEAQALHDVHIEVRKGEVVTSSAATAQARPRCCAA